MKKKNYSRSNYFFPLGALACTDSILKGTSGPIDSMNVTLCLPLPLLLGSFSSHLPPSLPPTVIPSPSSPFLPPALSPPTINLHFPEQKKTEKN